MTGKKKTYMKKYFTFFLRYYFLMGAATAILIITFIASFVNPSPILAVDYPSPSPSPSQSPAPIPTSAPSPTPSLPISSSIPASTSSATLSSLNLKGSTGDVIRASSLDPPDGWAVYVVNKFGFKRHIFNPDVFNMYGHLKWANVKEVSPSFLNGFTASKLYRTQGDSRVFSLDTNGIKHWLNMTPSEFTARGENWNAAFIINSEEDTYYTTGSVITPATPAPLPPPEPSRIDLTASLSPLNPASAAIESGTVFNTLLTVRLTAGSLPVSVNGLTITKKGLTANTGVTSISIWNSSTKLGNMLTALTSEGKAVFTFGTPLTIKANAGVDLDVKIGISKAISSGTVSMTIDSANDIQASTTNILGLFPIKGNTFDIVSSGQLGAFTLNAQTVGGNSESFPASGSGNLEIGLVQKELGKFQITESTGQEDLLLQNVTIFTEGSIQVNDFANWTLTDINGAKVALGDVVMPYIMFTLSPSLHIPSGTSRTFSLKADPISGADRTIRLHIQNDFDFMVKGGFTGLFIPPSNFSDTASSDGYWRIKN